MFLILFFIIKIWNISEKVQVSGTFSVSIYDFQVFNSLQMNDGAEKITVKVPLSGTEK